MCTQAEHNLPFIPKESFCWLTKGIYLYSHPTRTLFLLKHCQLRTLELLLYNQDNKTSPQLQEFDHHFNYQYLSSKKLAF